MKRLLVLSIVVCWLVSGPLRAEGFFSNYTFVPSIGAGVFWLYGPREVEDNILEEDGIWGAEQGSFVDLDFNAFRNRGTWSDSGGSYSLDIFPYFAVSRGKTVEYDEVGLKLGMVSRIGHGSDHREFMAVGIKFGEVDVDATNATTTDTDVRVSIPSQKQDVIDIYWAYYAEIDDGLGWHTWFSFKQFFLDGTRRADGSEIDEMEIEIGTFGVGLNFMI